MTWDELVAANRCECGQPLDTHSPLPKRRPLSSWKSQRTVTFNSGTVTNRTWTERARLNHERQA